MILINGCWEQVNSTEDIIRICRENIGDEFANSISSFYIKEYEEIINDLECEISDLEIECSDYDEIQDKLTNIEYNIEELENYIDKNADGSDFMMGMEKALNMIYQ